MTYSSPLSQRYASPAMQSLWGERRRIGLWRRLWLALMEVERELGVDIPERAPAQGDDLSRLLTATDNQAASPPAPPQGLYLVAVRYPADLYAEASSR